jgi:hypothetical protein
MAAPKKKNLNPKTYMGCIDKVALKMSFGNWPLCITSGYYKNK